MNAYVLSAAVGLLVGVIYGVLNVRSPAPPVIALVGLLGILAGEQIPPLVRHWLQRDTAQVGWIDQKVRPHMFGRMPGCEQAPPEAR
ncbi:XapX domain-containing protein, partial [Mitsuaria sp. GD03876]|uniref:XapX domain-containing protein n=1 Tax=Mitsuaria sp. GD03876 TaxID=2975399 RepID=UPI0024499E69